MSKREIDERFPYQVEIIVPSAGLAEGLTTIEAFLKHKGWRHAHRSARVVGMKDAVRWCFAETAHAGEFQAKFGGRLEVPDP